MRQQFPHRITAMNRLTTELQRLYLPPEQRPLLPDAEPEAPSLTDRAGEVRAVVVELLPPAGWNAAAALWQGVQAELGLPAPAIAVSGHGYQLWFSLAQAVSVVQAQAWLELLRRRFLAGIESRHVRLLPAADPELPGKIRHASLVPARQATGYWSAFVSPDLAVLFAEEPWLDLPPGTDAQADLLVRLESISPADFRQAIERLSAQPPELDVQPAVSMSAGATTAAASRYADPRQFLLEVMNDPGVELKWRIEAARALLPGFESRSAG